MQIRHNTRMWACALLVYMEWHHQGLSVAGVGAVIGPLDPKAKLSQPHSACTWPMMRQIQNELWGFVLHSLLLSCIEAAPGADDSHVDQVAA